MVLELIDYAIRNSGMTMLQGWYLTAAIWLITIMLFSWTFRKEAHSAIRTILFTLTSSFFILTLVLDPRLMFLPLFLVVWKSKGWARLMVALFSTIIIVDGLLLVLYSLYDGRSWRQAGVALGAIGLVLFIQWSIYGSPLPHLLKGISHQLTAYVGFPPMKHIDFIGKMYEVWWGGGGLALGIFSIGAAAFMWLQRNPLCCLLTTGLVIMTILNITLLADLWRYFAPQLMIFTGAFSPWKVVRR